MSRLIHSGSHMYIFAIGLFVMIFGAERAYSQCNVLCMHERGDAVGSVDNGGSFSGHLMRSPLTIAILLIRM